MATDGEVRRTAAVDDRAVAEDQRQLARERDRMVREPMGKGDRGAGIGIGEKDRRAQRPLSGGVGCRCDEVRVMRIEVPPQQLFSKIR